MNFDLKTFNIVKFTTNLVNTTLTYVQRSSTVLFDCVLGGRYDLVKVAVVECVVQIGHLDRWHWRIERITLV